MSPEASLGKTSAWRCRSCTLSNYSTLNRNEQLIHMAESNSEPPRMMVSRVGAVPRAQGHSQGGVMPK